MPSRKREAELLEAAWARIAQRLPPKPAHPKGGRPFQDDRACFEGIVYVLRNGIRWNAMPRCYPSSTTCNNRFNEWTALGLWDEMWRIVLEELDDARRLDTSELAIDATFAEARKGGTALAPQNAA
jgi:putative transposase